MLDALRMIGSGSLHSLWLPVLFWTGLAGAVVLLLAMARRQHPLIGYRLRQAILLALPASILVALWLPPVRWEPPVASVSEPPSHVPSDVPVASDATVAAGPSDPAFVAPAPATVATVSRAGLGADVVLHLLGSATIAALLLTMVRLWMLATHLRRLRVLRLAATPVVEPAPNEALAALVVQFGVRKPIELLRGPPGSVPMTFGVWRPVIMVPGDLPHSPGHLRTVLAHELIHVRRADYLWALLDSLTMVAFGFHPLVGFLRRQVEGCRETSCDARIIAAGVVRPMEYAELIVGVHAPAQFPVPAVAAAISASSVTLKERLETMVKFADLRPPSSRRGSAVLASGLLCFALAVACGSGVVDARAQVPSWRFETLWELNAVTAEFITGNVIGGDEISADGNGYLYLLSGERKRYSCCPRRENSSIRLAAADPVPANSATRLRWT